ATTSWCPCPCSATSSNTNYAAPLSSYLILPDSTSPATTPPRRSSRDGGSADRRDQGAPSQAGRSDRRPRRPHHRDRGTAHAMAGTLRWVRAPRSASRQNTAPARCESIRVPDSSTSITRTRGGSLIGSKIGRASCRERVEG